MTRTITSSAGDSRVCRLVVRNVTPDGEAIAVPHKTKSEAQMIANVFNHTKRDPKTVRTLADGRKEYVLVVVRGGVADLAVCPKGVEVDILDFDNLKDTAAGDARLSDKEWAYLKKNDPDEYARLRRKNSPA